MYTRGGQLRILVLGVTGMLGSVVYRYLSESGFNTWGTMRREKARAYFPSSLHEQLISNIDVENNDDLIKVFARVRPELVINCVGVIKQVACANDPLTVLSINALLPHRLAQLCALSQSRLIHISTDCVFSGIKGMYTEDDKSDADDLYGRSKYLGEISDLSHVFTIRTSMIGHELESRHSLVDWFLSQDKEVKGYTGAIFSGLPTIELASIIRDFIIPNKELFGLYHVVAEPIAKYELLKLIAERYHKDLQITPDDSVQIDRSLCGKRFVDASGYKVAAWPQLIEHMYQSRKQFGVV